MSIIDYYPSAYTPPMETMCSSMQLLYEKTAMLCKSYTQVILSRAYMPLVILKQFLSVRFNWCYNIVLVTIVLIGDGIIILRMVELVASPTACSVPQ